MSDTPRFLANRKRIGRRLAKARRSADKDVRTCALAVSVVPNTWHRWEDARAMIPADRLEAIAKTACCSIKFLLLGEASEKPPKVTKVDLGQKILDTFHQDRSAP